ncbi:DnaJ domain-containing protein [Cynara cardunculus var. scolymus]|uniref:DnaJ domain-containing protein n=1 Tax=Cynara cardunculus var. scolymus TaxID=59895 RepID=A0A118JWJ4_CYNCS|nr:DnaJ domain-containing protein [Cynara cardunculus var. scolymus]
MGKRKDTSIREEIMEDDDEQQQQNQRNLDESSSLSNDKSLYEILGVERTASQQEIKKAYHKLALRLHPDKNPDEEDAKEKFQQLQKVVSILGDEDKRMLYDQTGCVDDAYLAGDVVQNLKDFFRSMYKKVTEADIEEFEARYRGSESEKTDLIDLYNKYKGELKSTKAYKKWAKQVLDTKPPTDSLRRKEKSKKEPNDLYAIISQRQSERKGGLDSMFTSLLSKYGGGQPSSEPTDEEFEAARQNIEKRKAKHK